MQDKRGNLDTAHTPSPVLTTRFISTSAEAAVFTQTERCSSRAWFVLLHSTPVNTQLSEQQVITASHGKKKAIKNPSNQQERSEISAPAAPCPQTHPAPLGGFILSPQTPRCPSCTARAALWKQENPKQRSFNTKSTRIHERCVRQSSRLRDQDAAE